jgi:hypothetical protein
MMLLSVAHLSFALVVLVLHLGSAVVQQVFVVLVLLYILRFAGLLVSVELAVWLAVVVLVVAELLEAVVVPVVPIVLVADPVLPQGWALLTHLPLSLLQEQQTHLIL